MKKLLILLIIPFLSFGQNLTYVPDDGFELLIENEVWGASNGDNNDNYVYTDALNAYTNESGWNGVLYINNELAPIFDLTGLEDFNLGVLHLTSTYVSSLDLTQVGFVGEGSLYVSSNELLQTIHLPEDTIMHSSIMGNDALSNIVFNPGFCFSSFSVTGSLDMDSPPLCQIDFEGEIIDDVTWDSSPYAGSINIQNCANVVYLDLSGIVSAPYQTIVNYGDMYNSLVQINLNNPVSIYNWHLAMTEYWNPELSCVEVNSQSAVDFCNTIWPDFNYSTDCYSSTDCYNISIEESSSSRKSPISIVDILGRETSNKGLQLHIYDDGSVEKKYLVK